MSKVNMAIVVVAYNRVDSLSRLLQSLEKVDFEGQTVPLIISIDYSGENKVYDLVDAYKWKFGEKRIIRHSTNLGLKRHVLSCGDLVDDYDALIVLEDDLVVSESMYSYAWRAVEMYQNDANIESISLYGKIWSETAYQPFTPALSVFDTYFIQTAESWGQVWFKDKWKRFRKWYEDNSSCSFDSPMIPRNVQEWDQKSWKKYHIKYCIEKNLYTVYPYKSLTTCMGDVGEHTKRNTFVSQVPILHGSKKEYVFAKFSDSNSIKYDAFLERVYYGDDEICLDLYGWKKDFTGFKYVISSQILDYKIVDSYGLALRPHEENILRRIPGTDFFKYDFSEKEPNSRKKNRERLFEYYHFTDFREATNHMFINEIVKIIIFRLKNKYRKAFGQKRGK
ncbi:MAG: glycosyltransferase [Bacillus sp. (in: firmicutes)]